MTPWEFELLLNRHNKDIRFRAALAGAKLPDEEKEPEHPDQRLHSWIRYQALIEKQGPQT